MERSARIRIEELAPAKSSSSCFLLRKHTASGAPAEGESGKKPVCKDLESWAQVAAVPAAPSEE